MSLGGICLKDGGWGELFNCSGLLKPKDMNAAPDLVSAPDPRCLANREIYLSCLCKPGHPHTHEKITRLLYIAYTYSSLTLSMRIHSSTRTSVLLSS